MVSNIKFVPHLQGWHKTSLFMLYSRRSDLIDSYGTSKQFFSASKKLAIKEFQLKAHFCN